MQSAGCNTNNSWNNIGAMFGFLAANVQWQWSHCKQSVAMTVVNAMSCNDSCNELLHWMSCFVQFELGMFILKSGCSESDRV